jgi:Dolichyl-phosphate-mannose-protein mannosyltransferase
MGPRTGSPWKFWPAGRPGRILVVVALTGLLLFVDYHRERWRKGLLPRNNPQTGAGEGLVIRCDGLGYYAWLRSLLIDGDWSFDNEFDEHNVLRDFVPPPSWRTPTGQRALPWSVGPACWWALTVVPAHFMFQALEGWGWPWPADGYSMPYQLLVGCGTLFASTLGLFFLYGICRHFARPERAALAAALLTLGTTIVFYGAIEVSMAHGVGTMTVAALIWYWLRTYGSVRAGRWLVVGLLIGFIALMRWQLVTFAVLALGEAALGIGRGNHVGRRMVGLALTAGGAVVGFLPQMLAWRWVYGQWLAAPIVTEPHWLTPSLGALLVSPDRSLFYWTPLALLACVGYACLALEPPSRIVIWADCPQNAMVRTEPALLLLAAFLLQVYVLGSLWGGQVYLGVSFGLRHLTESLAALAPGLALLLERTRRPLFRFLWVLGMALMVWNLLLISQYRYGLVPAAGGADPWMMAASCGRLIVRKKSLLLTQVLAGPLLLALIWNGVGLSSLRSRFGNAGADEHRSWGKAARQTSRRQYSEAAR